MRIRLFKIVGVCALILFTYPTFSQKRGKKPTSAAKLRDAEFYFTEGEKYYILEDYAKALERFQKSLDINSKNATVYYKIAQVYSQGSELDKALQNALKALELEKENKYFYELVANIYTQLGDFSKAAETYETLIGKVDKTDIYLFELAALYLYQQRFEDAIDTYDKVEKAYGVSEEIIFQKQKIHLQLNDLESALTEGNKLIETFPYEERFVIKQAEILMSNGREEESKKYLQAFLDENPSGYQSRLILAELKRRSGDVEGAFDDLKICFENPDLNPENKVQLLADYRASLPQQEILDLALPLSKIVANTHTDIADAHVIYGDLLQQTQKTELAKNAYQESIKIDPSSLAVWQNIIQLHFELNKTDSAAYYSGMALELFPNQGVLYYFNGAANLQEGNDEEAVYALEQGKKLSSANLNLLNGFNSLLGDAYNSVKEFEKSDAAYEASLDFDPNNDGVLNNYSYFLALRKYNLDKAASMSKATVDRNPENVTFLDTYAWVLYIKGDYKEAKKIMERAIDLGGVEAVHYDHYGDILFKLGEVDAAVKQWEVAKEMDPSMDLLDRKIAERKLYE